MIGDDVYAEFEKSRLKAPSNKAWYNENMTAAAASYILSYAEVTSAKELQPEVEVEEEKRLGKALSAKQKKDLWDAKVKEVCAGRSSKAKRATKETTKKNGRKKKDQSNDEAGQGSQQQPASNDAMEVQPDYAMPAVDENQPEPATAREEGRQRKRAKKQSDGMRVYEGLFRTDQFIDIPNQFAVLKGSLKSTYDTLQGNKTRAKIMPIPIINELRRFVLQSPQCECRASS
ncbi:hypothetical protein R1sor_003561 [Riccia sorocarpa]|uniref:Uncharacterized protein n=1 Tax=Riccia sorocarpa TaxID=122646 RepID=A0ABD3H5V9_9MARC